MKGWYVALSSLKRKSKATIAAVLILSFGIAAVTATVSVGSAVFVRSLPWKDADRVVIIKETGVTSGHSLSSLEPATYFDLRNGAHGLTEFAAWVGVSRNLRGGISPEALNGVAVSPGLFSLLGIKPELGRIFDPKETAVSLISDALWKRQFNGNPNVIGKAIELDGKAFQIIGVLSRDQQYPEQTDFWIPLGSFTPLFSLRGVPLFSAAARLRPGANLSAVQGEVDSIATRVHKQFPNGGDGFRLVPFREALFGNTKSLVLLLLLATFFLLGVACVNLMIILLSKTLDRRSEIAMQMTLGASRRHLALQFVREGFLLSGGGGVLGLCLAPLLFFLVQHLLPQQSFVPPTIGLDVLGLITSLLISTTCGLVFATFPLFLYIRNTELRVLLFSQLRRSDDRFAGAAWNTLVSTEIAFTVVLCVGAGLLLKSLVQLSRVQLGLDPVNVLSVRLNLTGPQYAPSARKIVTVETVLQKISSLPEVEADGLITFMPLGGAESQSDVLLPPSAVSPQPKITGIVTEAVSGEYFQTLRIPLLRGRLFGTEDGPDAPRVCLLNEAFLKEFFPRSDPIGETISVGQADAKYRVVGIVGNVRGVSSADPPRSTVFVKYEQAPWAAFDLVVRSRSKPENLIPSVQKAVWSVDPDLPLIRVATIDGLLKDSLGDRQTRTSFLSIYAFLCLCLAGMGLYAVLSYAAEKRRREIAVRMALGATRAEIFGSIIRRGIIPIAIGVVAGIALSLVVNRLLAAAGVLYEVTSGDPVTLVTVAIFVAIVGVATACIPARQACIIEPAKWLRYE
jgi:predicted permease